MNSFQNAGSSLQKGNDLFLDTKGACFLCLKEPSSDSGGATGKVCLRDFCRFLKIDSCSVLVTGLKDIIQNEEASFLTREKRDFSVLLCTTCSFQTDKLTDLIRRMEVMEMLLRNQLEELQRILVESGDDDEFNCRWKKVKEKMISGCLSLMDARLVERLRSFAKEKCSTKICKLGASSLPKIRLDKLPVTTQQMTRILHEVAKMDSLEAVPAPATTSIVSSDPVADHTADHCKEEAVEEEETNQQRIVSPSCSTSRRQSDDRLQSAVANPALESFAKNYCVTPDNRLKCLNCKFVGVKKSEIRRHVLNQHPERILAFAKSALVPDEAFGNCCKKMFLLETKESTRKARLNTSSAPEDVKQKQRCFCSSCKQYFRNGECFRYHLVKDHYRWCKIILDRRQQIYLRSRKNENRTRERGRKKSTISSCGKGRGAWKQRKIQCPKIICNPPNGGCGKQFSNKANLHTHQTSCCPKSKIKRTWKCNLADGGCGGEFSQRGSLNRHIINNRCPARNGKKYLPCGNLGAGCRKLFSTKDTLQIHLNCFCKFRKPKRGRASSHGVKDKSSEDTNVITAEQIEHVALSPQLEVKVEEEIDQSTQNHQCQYQDGENGYCMMETENSSNGDGDGGV